MRSVISFVTFAFVFVSATAVQAQRRDVDLKAADGTLIKATYFSAGKPGPGIVLLHMCNSQRKAWDNLATMLAARGLHTVTMDYRGFGESGGKPFAEMSQQERQQAQGNWPDDIYAVFNYLVAQPGVDRNRIGAAGGSCGVENALQLARRRGEVKTLVLLAGGGTQASWDHLAESAWMPVFGSAARDDGNAVEAMKWLVGFSSNPASLLKEYANGGHGTDMFPVHKDLEPAIAAWFEQHLVKTPVHSSSKLGPPGPSGQLLEQLRQPGGAAQTIERMREARKAGRAFVAPPEAAVNALGYALLQGGRAGDSIPLFQLNVEAYPNSANTYDSLSDGYLAAGDREKALEFAQKAIEALSRDTQAPEAFKQQIRQGAEQKIQQLRGAAPTVRPADTPARPAPPATPPPAEVYRMPAVLRVTGMESVKVKNDVVYKTVDGAPSKLELKMDVYSPATAKPGDRFPAVILISGGGVGGPPGTDWRDAGVYVSYGRILAATGFVGIPFSKRFARSSTGPTAGESDLLDLIRYVREHAAEYNVDPERLAVWGFSGGGWLLSTALREPQPYLKAVICFYGVMDVGANVPEADRAALVRFSSVAAVKSNGAKVPPVLVARAGLDNPGLNGGIDAFVREALAQNIEIEVLNHANGRHGFDILDDNERSREIIRTTIEFLKQRLRAPS